MPTLTQDMSALFEAQRNHAAQGALRSASARQLLLKTLKEALKAFEERLLDALYADLRKPRMEAYLGEIALIYEEIDQAVKHLEGWMRPRRVRTPLLQSPAASYVQPEPYGTVAIIGPWNYPVQLLLVPMVGAIAAGNTVMLKPSEHVPHTSQILAEMVEAYFAPHEVALIQGAVAETQELLSLPLDYIFFTGSTAVGKIVMQAAAQHLTPLTLELGGKSPAIIDHRTDWDTTMKRVTWAKFFNLGQTCVAPDYLLVPKDQKQRVFGLLKKHLHQFYGENPQQSPDLARIVSQRHLRRLQGMLTGEIVIGGEVDEADLYLAPTVLDVQDPDTHPSMQEEIFGPILPVIGYDTLDDAIAFVKARPKPLALYLFSNNTRCQKQVLDQTSSGSVCINDAVIQFSTSKLPFGGVGPSGMGKYHGESSFETFSHQKGVMKRNLLIDPAIRYPPYKTPLTFIKDILTLIG